MPAGDRATTHPVRAPMTVELRRLLSFSRRRVSRSPVPLRGPLTLTMARFGPRPVTIFRVVWLASNQIPKAAARNWAASSASPAISTRATP
jgi:hypothetical protein